MIRYFLRRFVMAIPTLIGVSIITFAVMRLVPGDPTDILAGTDPIQSVAIRERLRAELGLDRPLPEQYVRWMSGVVRGDFGSSLLRGTPVSAEIAQRLPVTLQLAAYAIVLTVIIGVPTGVAAAVFRGSRLDTLVRLSTFTAIASPSFLIATVLILALSLYMPSIQTMGYVLLAEDPLASLQLMFFPAISLAIVTAAVIARFTRATLIEVLREDYVRTARAKGLAPREVIFEHAVRNSLIPVVTILGVQFAFLLGGTVVIEQVFALPGLGRLIVTAVNQRDYPVVQAGVMLLTAAFILVNLAVDLIYPLLDPRISRRA